MALSLKNNEGGVTLGGVVERLRVGLWEIVVSSITHVTIDEALHELFNQVATSLRVDVGVGSLEQSAKARVPSKDIFAFSALPGLLEERSSKLASRFGQEDAVIRKQQISSGGRGSQSAG